MHPPSQERTYAVPEVVRPWTLLVDESADTYVDLLGCSSGSTPTQLLAESTDPGPQMIRTRPMTLSRVQSQRSSSSSRIPLGLTDLTPEPLRPHASRR